VLPALTGLVQAVFAVFLALGTAVPDTTQTGILALLAAAGAFFVRQNVVAPVPSGALPLASEQLIGAYDRGFEDGQDQAAAPADVPEKTSGAHGLTETFPRVQE
jgi:hypothetical protein